YALSFLLSLTPLRPPHSPLFPYTTLFRSDPDPSPSPGGSRRRAPRSAPAPPAAGWPAAPRPACAGCRACPPPRTAAGRSPSRTRSEEHTSELESRENLVCRLLLEKKKSHA